MNRTPLCFKSKHSYIIILFLILILFSGGLLAQTTFEGFESGDFCGLKWTTDTPNNQWNITTYMPYAGTCSALSNGYYHNSYSNLNLNINVLTAGNIGFVMKTDTENWGAPFGDFLRFYIDGVLQNQWAGTIGWTYCSFAISAGVHNLSWSFHRDNSDTYWGGFRQNKVWIDNISFPANYFFTGEGTGFAGNPYQITTAAQLNSIRNFMGSNYSNIYFKLMNDIDLTAYLTEGGEGFSAWGPAGWSPLGTNAVPFQGHFDGNNKTISGLMINRSTLPECGFWGATGTTAVIENLHLKTADASTVQGANATGMLVGRNNGTINNCSAAGKVRGAIWDGGIVGWNNGTLNRCYATGDVIGAGNTVGGIVGQNNGYIYNSYSHSAVNGVNYVGGIVGYQGQGGAAGITNSFSTGSVTNTGDAYYRGGILGWLNSGTVSNSYWDRQTSGLTTSFGSDASFGKTTTEMQNQSTFAGWDFAGETANGTNEYWFINPAVNDGYPYLVWEQTATANPVLAHINVNPSSLAFGSVYPGTFNPQTFTITNSGQLTLSGSITTLTTYSVSESVTNTNLLNFSIAGGTSQTYTLTFAPTAYGMYNGNVVITSNSETQSTFNLAVSGTCIPVPETFAGGSGTQTDPWLISTSGQLSRLNDFLGTTHSDKYYKLINDIDMTDYFLQGNAGYNYGYFWNPIGNDDSPFYGKMDGNHCSISGFKSNHSTHQNFEANLGLFGVTGSEFVLKNLNLQVDVVAGYHQIGGLVGVNSGIITNCHVTTTTDGAVVSFMGFYAGGFVGINTGMISKCSFKGSVLGTVTVGGFAGGVGSGSSFYDCFVTGTVKGYDKVGGFSGSATGLFQNCYSSVVMDYSSNTTPVVGGFSAVISYLGTTFNSCYWNRELSNTTTSPGLNASFGKTTVEMQTTSTYVGYDMDLIWKHQGDLNDGYPFIRLAPATVVTNVQSFNDSLLIGENTSKLLSITNTGADNLYYTLSVEYPTRNTQYILQEDFEHGGAMPTGWTQQTVSGDNLNWTCDHGNGFGYPDTGFYSSYNALLVDSDIEDDKTLLISPPLDLQTNSYSPQLSFYHYMQPYFGRMDSLAVYYKTSANGTWTLIQTIENSNLWSTTTLNLPNPSAEYYIGFQGNAKAGFGVCIDRVAVTASPAGYADSWLSLNNNTRIEGIITSRLTHNFNINLNTLHLSAGTYQANIRISSNAYGNNQVLLPVTLEVGYGNNPQITVTPDTLNFGERKVGTSAPLSFTLSNIGNVNLVGSINPPSGYSVSQDRNLRNTLNFNIPAGTSQVYNLTFTPEAAVSYNGNMVINSNSYLDIVHNTTVTGSGYILPTISLDSQQMSTALPAEGIALDTLFISNTGSQPLNYNIVISNVQRHSLTRNHQKKITSTDRNIAGSTLTTDVTEYTAGTTVNWTLSVYNTSTDNEWLKYVHLNIPAGIVVNSVSNFTGGSGGAMIPDQTSGNGITIVWTGINAGWGVVYGNQTAVAVINVTIPSGMVDPLNLNYQIDGDIYGSLPHSVTGTITLDATPPQITWITASPSAGTITGGNNQMIIGNFNAAGLQTGLYEAEMIINSNDSVNPVKSVQVLMNVLPPAGPVVNLSLNGSARVLSWNAVTHATSYLVFRADNPFGEFIQISSTTNLSYEDTDDLNKAFYRVKAVLSAPAKK